MREAFLRSSKRLFPVFIGLLLNPAVLHLLPLKPGHREILLDASLVSFSWAVVALGWFFWRKEGPWRAFTRHAWFAGGTFLAALILWFHLNFLFYEKFPWLKLLPLLGLNLLLLSLVYHHLVKPRSRATWALVLVVLLQLFLLGEGFSMFLAQTHGYARTYANNRWYRLHGGPYNRYGYRGTMPDEAALARGPLLMLVGDSFLAGSAIRKCEDRFSDRLAAKLAGVAQVVNLGVGGAEPQIELERVKAFPHQPDYLVMVWVPNDIKKAVEAAGYPAGEPFSYDRVLPWPLHFLVSHSSLLNSLYWQLPHDHFPEYQAALARIHADPNVLALHLQDMQAMQQWAAARGIPFMVMLFPNFQAPDLSADLIGPVMEGLDSLGIPALNLRPLFVGRDPGALIANPMDGHPNEGVHGEVGDTLWAYFGRVGWFGN